MENRPRKGYAFHYMVTSNMKVHDAEIESKEALKEAFVQKEPIKVGNIIYVPKLHTPSIASGVGVCQLCRYYRIKGLCKSHIADKVCSACGEADLYINYCYREPDLVQRAQLEVKLHYLQTPT